MRRVLPLPEPAQLLALHEVRLMGCSGPGSPQGHWGEGPPRPEASLTPCHFGPCQLGSGAGDAPDHLLHLLRPGVY